VLNAATVLSQCSYGPVPLEAPVYQKQKSPKAMAGQHTHPPTRMGVLTRIRVLIFTVHTRAHATTPRVHWQVPWQERDLHREDPRTTFFPRGLSDA
jgi:tellurite resistance-related uncharacterized protein